MPNIMISGLPPVTLPLDPLASFFEVQTFEAGVEVSRKISADEMGIGGSVNSVNSGVNITVDNTDPINPIVNLDAAIAAVSVNGVTLNDAGAATNFLDETGAYSIPPGTSPLTTVGDLYTFNGVDARLPVGADGLVLTADSGEATGLIWAAAGGGSGVITFEINADINTATPPTTEAVTCMVEYLDLAGDDSLGFVGYNAGNDLQVQNRMQSGEVILRGEDLAGIQRLGARFNFDAGGESYISGFTTVAMRFMTGNEYAVLATLNAGVDLRHNNIGMARTVAIGSGGMEVNNTVTGAGFERVLTSSDAGGGISDPLIIGSVNFTSALSTSALGAPYANVPINVGANLTGTQGMTQIARQRIQTKPSAFSFNSTLFINVDGAGTAGSNTFIGGLNSASIEVDFGVAVRLQHGLVNAHVMETIATGIFLEQGSLVIEEKAAAEANVATRGEYWVINSAPNRPMFTDDAGTDFDLTLGAFDTAANYVMSGSWEFTNALGIEFGPSCELRLRNNADTSHTFIQNTGPVIQFGIAGADFGSGVFEIAQTSFVRLESPSIFIREQAAGADILQEGQLYVRADTFSNTLMYRNDVGSDYEIAGIPYNGDLLDGAGLLADTVFVGWVNIGPKPNTDYTLICQGQITAPAIDDGKVQLTCDTNSIFTGLYTDSTGKVEGVRSAIGEVVTNTVVVPTDGSATDDGTFFTIIGMFQAGATGQTTSLRAAKNADGGADGSIVRPSMSVVRLVEA